MAQGVTWTRRSYVKPRPDWDHDHCDFCFAKFIEQNDRVQDALAEGYVSKDEQHWVCPNCFEDFRVLFAWTITDG